MSLENLSSDATVFDADRVARVGQWLEKQITLNRIAGGSVLIGQAGRHQYFHASGIAGVSEVEADARRTNGTVDADSARPFDAQTIVRLYSMTKPVTTVAALMLMERGAFELDDPIARYLPAFADMRVWDGEGELVSDNDIHKHSTTAKSLITVRQLMNHTSGLTYGFMNATPVDQMYRDRGLVFPGSSEHLEALVDRLAQVPLLCHPGAQWNYSVATDVLGRLVEVWSGKTLSDFFRTEIFEPLGMQSTGFHVLPDSARDFADLYGPASGGELGTVNRAVEAEKPDLTVPTLDPPVALDVAATSSFLKDPPLYSGGGGLVGSIEDYARFCQCLLNDGALDGKRLLGRKSVHFMRTNQLPDNRDMAAMGQPLWSETNYHGIGFGLGVAVILDPVKAGTLSSTGEHHWGGAASTFFWIDPSEDLYVVFFTQLYPSSSYPLRSELRTVVYQSLV